MTGKESFFNASDGMVKKFPNDKWLGIYSFRQRGILVKDINLAKLILVKDADHFMDRPSAEAYESDLESDKIANMFLTNLKGEQWKKLRAIVSPVFTSGKLKGMVPIIDKCANNLDEVFEAAAKSGKVLEAKSLFGKFTLDAIATSGFGIESNSFKEPDSVFRTTALKLTRAEGYGSKWDIPKFFILFVSPRLSKILGLTQMPTGTTGFFAGIIKQTVQNRKETGIRRNDIIDLLLDELDKDKESDVHKDFDMEIALISNAIIFFFAGFETSSTGLAVSVFQFVTNPSIQEKARQEIEDVIGDATKITADHLMDLKYLDNCINEALRIDGLVNSLQRICTKDYKIPDTDFIIPKGMQVNIYGKLLTKESFYNPDNFDPDNFDPHNPNKFGFFGFGQGPRNCIGMRYAYMALK